ncbi:MAG: DegT/DnrJ/EryC1/StrS family aminotransferase [Vicinamibacterales bacterium]
MAVPAAAHVDFAPPAIGAEEIAAVEAVLRSGWLSTGPRVKAFEEAFAAYTGSTHAVAVNSCTAALHLALLVAGIEPGDEVVTTPLTFCATANTIVHVGAVPRFADIDPITWNLDPAAAHAAVTSRTRACLPVHYAGRPVDVSAFRALAARHDLRLIEDAAHCVEGEVAGAKIGRTADLTCFSFYATKNLTTGEGGMLTTESSSWAQQARRAALHGMDRDAWRRYAHGGSALYDIVTPGFKYNMPDLLAAIGLQQLVRLEAHWRRREAIWARYDEAFADLPITRPAPAGEGVRHARHLYTILVNPDSGWTRDELADALRRSGIVTSIHFRAVHLFTYYAERFGFRRGMCPAAERVADTTLSLPLSAALRDEEIDAVIAAVRRHLLRTRQR